jgi:hypothetical protein
MIIKSFNAARGLTGLMATLLVATAYAGPFTIDLGDESAKGHRDVVFATVWSRPAEDEDFLLARVTDAAIDGDGNICVVDYQQKDLKIFDGQGNWLRTLGGEGEGPGECSDARRLFLGPDGRYGILQAFPACIVWLQANGDPAGRVRLGDLEAEPQAMYAAAHAVQAGQDIYVWVRRAVFDGGEPEELEWIATVAADGQLGSALYQPPEQASARTEHGIDEGRVYDIWMRRWTPDGQGGVWVAPERNRYLLQHWNGAGELVMECRRDYEPVQRNEEARADIVTWFLRRGWSTGQIEVGRTAPVFNALRLGDDGNLWASLDQGGHDPTGDLILVFDVISPDGRWLEQLRLRGEAADQGTRLLDDHTILILVEDPDTVDELILSLQRAAAP